MPSLPHIKSQPKALSFLTQIPLTLLGPRAPNNVKYVEKAAQKARNERVARQDGGEVTTHTLGATA